MNVYVIMPVGADPDYEQKRKILGRVAAALGVECHLPMETREDGRESPGDVMRSMNVADAVIGDLSLERPSCYFELGLAQALGKPTVLIAKRGTVIHQAFGRQDTEFFDNLREYSEILERALSRPESVGSQGMP